MECPVCEFPESREWGFLEDRFFHSTTEEFRLYLCESCGLLFQDPSIGNRLDEFYPRAYWSRSGGGGDALESTYRKWVLQRDQLRFLRAVTGEEKPRNLLDIGCGSGLFVKLARHSRYDAMGLDTVPELQDLENNIRIGTLDELIEEGRTFDLITLFHTLEHVTDPFSFLKKVRRLLENPGGLIVQVPNRSSYQAKLLGRRWYGLDCPRHVCNYSLYSLLYLLGRAGFRIRKTRHFSLRDNAPALVSSLFPGLDPVSQRVLRAGPDGMAPMTLGYRIREFVYFGFVLLAQPLAWTEAKLGKGGTVTVFATLDS